MWYIIIVVNQFSKYAIFIAAPKDGSLEETIKLFFKHVVSIGAYHKASSVIEIPTSNENFGQDYSSL